MTGVAEAAQEFAALAKNLTLVGADELRRELYDAINEAARPIQGDIRDALKPHLPDPYATDLDADLSIRTSKRAGADPGVHIEASARGHNRKLRRLNDGVLSHPLYGNREHWYTQRVTPGFFDRPIEAVAPQVREHILAAMRRIEDKALGR